MKKPIPILSVDNTFTFGGAINSLYHAFRALDKSLFIPVVVSGQPLKFLEDRFPDCVCYHFVPKLPWIDNRRYRKIESLRPFQRSRLLNKGLNMARFCYWLIFISFPEAIKYWRIGRRHRVALLHFNNGFLHLSWILAAKLLRVPCVSHLRGFVEVGLFARLCARVVDHHVAISKAVRGNLLELGVPESRISLVHDGIDPDEFKGDVDFEHLLHEFGLALGQPTFGIFGRVVGWKGVREFIHAARLVTAKIPEARGFVVGDRSDGDERFFDEMHQLRAELGLEDKVVFTGYRKDVPAMMALMDVIVHASSEPEPFGMVIIEGMAMGKAVVATRAGGPLDIVEDGQTGYLVEIRNAEALGEAVTALLQNSELRSSMGRKGRERVDKFFSNRLYARKMERIFLQLCSSDNEVQGATRSR